VQLAKCWKLRASSGTHPLSHPPHRVDIVGSDKPTGADNQQERPLAAEWVVGFVDGEGCFSIPIFRNRSCRLGWQVQPEFAVVQGERSASVLFALEAFFGCGVVSVNRRNDNHRQDMWRFSVRRLADLQKRIVPFFEANPLRTAKACDFAGFAAVICLMARGDHLSMDGLSQIAAIAMTTNRRKPSQLVESSEAIRQPSHLDG
jgi:LAGLIDADG endonuclease